MCPYFYVFLHKLFSLSKDHISDDFTLFRGKNKCSIYGSKAETSGRQRLKEPKGVFGNVSKMT